MAIVVVSGPLDQDPPDWAIARLELVPFFGEKSLSSHPSINAVPLKPINFKNCRREIKTLLTTIFRLSDKKDYDIKILE
jgi:hypothetical protein